MFVIEGAQPDATEPDDEMCPAVGGTVNEDIFVAQRAADQDLATTPAKTALLVETVDLVGVERDRLKHAWKIDRYASRLSFDGWKERENRPYFETPSGYFGPLVAWPRTYFLSTGWRRYGLIGIDEVPGCGDE